MAQVLGEAKGTINLDASPVQAAAAKIRTSGQQIQTSLSGVGNAAGAANVSLGKLGKVVGAVGGIFGVQMGIGIVKQIGDVVVANDKLYTSYKRQMVAARELAGSQAHLNDLLRTYQSVTKGAVDDATALGDVTRMQAVGFADTTAELQTFLTAAKGISVAMGKDQDYVIGQLQLSIANQSTMRLDQIGLGVTEVKNRIKELKAETKGLTTEMAYQEAVIGIAVEKYGSLVESEEAAATGMERLTKAMKDNRLAAAEDMDSPVNKVTGFFAGEIEKGGIRQQVSKKQDEAMGKFFKDLIARIPSSDKGGQFDNANQQASDAWKDLMKPISEWFEAHKMPTNQDEFDKKYRQGYYDPIASHDKAMLLSARSSTPSVSQLPGTTAFPAEQARESRALIADHYRQIQDIEKKANSARLQATQDYERQRSQIIQRYGLTLVREAEDYALGVSRASTEFNRSVADMERDAGRREADARENFERGIGELRKGNQERISEITKNYHRDMERAEADHKEKLLGSAARLDAAGVVAEKRRFAKEKKNKETNFKQSVKKLQDSLEKQEKQRKEALERQLEVARRNDERRLEDMKRDFEYRQQIEIEDRGIRLRRMQEDHQAQLDEMAANQQLRMDQINQQEQDEKLDREEKFKAELIQAGIHHEKWLEDQKRWEDKSLASFEDFWDGINSTIMNRGSTEATGDAGAREDPASPVMRQFGDGGPVNRTGPAIVHAGEFVLNAQTTAALKGMHGNLTNRSILEATGGKSITVAEGAIQIQASEGMNVEALGQIVRSEMLAVLQVAN